MIDILRPDGTLVARAKMLCDLQQERSVEEYETWKIDHDETIMEEVVIGQDQEGNDITGSQPVNVFTHTEVTEADLDEYLKPYYKELRQAEYPPMAMYLDAIVKGDEAQKAQYVAMCEAIKLKYPKELT